MAEGLPDLGRRALEVAPDLLGCILQKGSMSGRIVEVEAYESAEDPASHAHRGRTDRNRVMFGPPGCLYVYLIYGMHHCANVVCGPPGEAGAVLIRALAPVGGVDRMWPRRSRARRLEDLCSGPGKLCAALGIDRDDDGLDLLGDAPVRLLVPDEDVSPRRVVCGPRVGISVATERHWRFAFAEEPNVSRPRTGLTRDSVGYGRPGDFRT